MAKVYVIGTMDTKGEELRFARDCIIRAGAEAVLVDVGTRGPGAGAEVGAEEIAAHHPEGASAVLGLDDRGKAVAGMAEALTRWLSARGDIGAVLGLGGSGNTALVTQAMRALPVGTPKLMVSTVASGNVAPYVGPADIALMYSVVDVAGINAISRRVIANAAHAAAGMALFRPPSAPAGEKPGIGMSMFGVTTGCITALREALEPSHECYVFHATGAGGQSMEKLADSGLLSALIDITTTEVPDHLVGGVFPCTGDRFGAAIRTRLPYVGSVGAVDMVNFGAKETVPAQFGGRNLYVHNPQVTLMRTTPAENKAIAEFIVARLNRMEGPVRFLLPLGGVSAIDVPGMPFHDPAADEALFATIRAGFVPGADRKLIEVPAAVNDREFVDSVLAAFKEIA
ncbi:Tm-1-like ATP-binding domain-containing protein [Sabulicella glaciei]|uniref:Tm-1-like ATP-binding domain-containing protein n=1 Tax=Sabulicella glaciei TaxID=2984948 RepID=A0ABT3NPR9_9PROT|nr:Tm-1-like ATP-binding domain-containing protein [Roseococcus sp. MDT2-1-1]MCW8084150.1 Tm-1-like ATP-binding domain-containing protein [Roseococcus sp. MDT2-1-1]